MSLRGPTWLATVVAALSCHEPTGSPRPPEPPEAREAPASRPAAPKLVAIDGGYVHMCVLDSVGAVRCWGGNERGQLGYGDTAPIAEGEAATRSTPVEVGARVVQLAVGGFHTCTVLDGGAVKCWGDNRAGQTGTPWPKQIALPTDIAYANFSGGKWQSHEAQKRGYAWPAASEDPVPAIGDDEVPADVEPLVLPEPVTHVAAGSFHSCALTKTGRVFCWGWLDGPEPRAVHEVPLPRPAVELVAGKHLSCVRFADGGIRCWGENRPGRREHCSIPSCLEKLAALDPDDPRNQASLRGFGRLGYLAVDQVAAADVTTQGDLGHDFGPWTEPGPFPRDFTYLTAGDHQVCGIRRDGTIACWGDSYFAYGANVNPPLANLLVGWAPVSFLEPGDPRTVGLSSIGIDVCAVDQAGDVRCWGGPFQPGSAGTLWLGGQPQAELKSDMGPPPPVPLPERAEKVAVQNDRACALLASGSVACWGRLGHHGEIQWNAPAMVPTPEH